MPARRGNLLPDHRRDRGPAQRRKFIRRRLFPKRPQRQQHRPGAPTTAKFAGSVRLLSSQLARRGRGFSGGRRRTSSALSPRFFTGRARGSSDEPSPSIRCRRQAAAARRGACRSSPPCRTGIGPLWRQAQRSAAAGSVPVLRSSHQRQALISLPVVTCSKDACREPKFEVLDRVGDIDPCGRCRLLPATRRTACRPARRRGDRPNPPDHRAVRRRTDLGV